MKLVKILFVVVLLLTCSSSVVSIYNKKNLETNDVGYDTSAELPTWNKGNYWKYDMDFGFIVRNNGFKEFSVVASINNMNARVTNTINYEDDEVYVLLLDGDISGKIFILGEIDLADIDADLDGVAYISTSTLGIKYFNFDVEGKVNLVGWRDIDFDMVMNFVPEFNFFDFPINVKEDPWEVYIDEASLSADVYVDLPGPFDFRDSYSSSMVFNDNMSINRTETIDIPAGIFETIVIDGSWGYYSNLYYSDCVGYLAKIVERLYWPENEGQIESIFNLELIETNFDGGNIPPNKPDRPYGQTDGIAEEEYQYRSETTDPENEKIYYLFDWGDGTDSGWVGPYNSGDQVIVSNRWYNKGIYSVIVKAKDETGIESLWSDPLIVKIMGDPNVDVFVCNVTNSGMDDIDVGSDPEWYYMVHAESSGLSSPPEFNYNTDDGTENGNWISEKTWEAKKNHRFKGYSRNVTIKLKLMDHDDRWEDPIYAADDLADVSGCIGGGVDQDTPNKRGAMYYGTYDLVENKLKDFQTGDPLENADYVYKKNDYYITAGDHIPDESYNEDENDAKICFKLFNDYEKPIVNARILNEPERIRPMQNLQFVGSVQNGAPEYKWSWDFDDGTILKDDQKPEHSFQNKGTYDVTLTLTDGFNIDSIFKLNVKVENYDPVLTDDKVKFDGKGDLDDTFTFSVNYQDLDGDDPDVKTVVINGKSWNLNGFGANSEYSLALKGRDIGQGSHEFYFYFEDGHGGSAQTEPKNLEVSKTKVKTDTFFLKLMTFFKENILSKIVNLNHITLG